MQRNQAFEMPMAATTNANARSHAPRCSLCTVPRRRDPAMGMARHGDDGGDRDSVVTAVALKQRPAPT
jgi:hypothetical protein